MGFVTELRDLWPESITAVGAVKHGSVLRKVEKLELAMYAHAAFADTSMRAIPAEEKLGVSVR